MKLHTHPIKRGARIMSRFFMPVTIVVVSLALSACAGGKKNNSTEANGAEKAVSQDITRPPQTIVGRQEQQEQNPEETISFDEWRKKRLEEQRK